MKILVLLLAVLSPTVPTDGGSISLAPDFNEPIKLPQVSSEHEVEDDQGSFFVRSVLKNIFSFPEWKKLIVKSATSKELTDPTFQKKWNIRDDDVTFADDKEETRLRAIWKTPPWKGFIALMSTKSELLNSDYRVKWMLGALTDEVKNSDENGNFFQSPQWKEFLKVTRTTKNLDNPETRLKWLRNWVLEAMNMMSELYWSLGLRKQRKHF